MTSKRIKFNGDINTVVVNVTEKAIEKGYTFLLKDVVFIN